MVDKKIGHTGALLLMTVTATDEEVPSQSVTVKLNEYENPAGSKLSPINTVVIPTVLASCNTDEISANMLLVNGALVDVMEYCN